MRFKLQIILAFLRIRWQKRVHQGDYHRLQERKWKRFQAVLKSSPFYRERAEANTALADYPIMNKAQFMANFDAINTQNIALTKAMALAQEAEKSRDFSPMIGDVTVGLSSGTSGNRGVFLVTEKERIQWVATVIDRVIGLRFRKRNVAFFLRANSNLYDAVKSKLIRFEFFDLMDAMPAHVKRLNDLQPHLLIAQPSVLLDLAVQAAEGSLVIHPEKVISVAEVLYPEDRAIIEAQFGQRVHQVYQCTEGFLASSCAEGKLHFNEDFLIIEKKYLDETKTRFHPIITDLHRFSQPIVRYELNDIIHEEQACACGQSTLAIAQIEGRSDDVLTFRSAQDEEVRIYPDFFRRAIILADRTIADYLVMQKSATELELFVHGTQASYTRAASGIERLLEEYEVLEVRIARLSTKPHQPGSKLRRIRNEQD